MENDEELKAELDCIVSVYEHEVEIIRHNKDLEIRCNVRFTNTSYEIIVCFAINMDEKAFEISIKNTEQSNMKLQNNIISKIKSKLTNVHKDELNNMPIFQCISYIYTEMIDVKHLLVDQNKKSIKNQVITTPKKKKKTKKPWWLTIGSRIEYKYKQKNWKNGAITRISNNNKINRITIKFWKSLSVQKCIELTEENVLELIEKQTIKQSNIVYPLWIHTHSPIWILLTNCSWRSGKIIHYIDGKHIMIKYNDDNDNNSNSNDNNNTLMFDKTSSIYVKPNWLNIRKTNALYIIEPFSIYWNAYTSKYLTNIYTTNVIYNSYYNIIYDILYEIPVQICTVIIDYLGFDAINMSPTQYIKSQYKLWTTYKDVMVGVTFTVQHQIKNVFGIELDVNVNNFGQVFGLLNSAKPHYGFWHESSNNKLIDNYTVEMLQSDDWEHSDYLRMFFFENKIDKHDDKPEKCESNIIKKPVQINLQPNRTYRLGFATKSDLPIFYWRQGYVLNQYSAQRTGGNKIASCSWGAFTMEEGKQDNCNRYLFQSKNMMQHFSLNFRILIA